MITNGLLVTANRQDDLIRGSWYRGPCFGRPWPLESIEVAGQSAEIVTLNAEVCEHFDDYVNSVAVVPDVKLVKRYAAECWHRGIGIRFLLLSSDPTKRIDSLTALAGVEAPVIPRMSVVEAASLTRFSHELGYDYCAPWLEFSIIEMGIEGGRSPELTAFKSKLNDNGLFLDLSEAADFIRVHRSFQLANPSALEDDSGCVVFHVQEVSNAAFIGPA